MTNKARNFLFFSQIILIVFFASSAAAQLNVSIQTCSRANSAACTVEKIINDATDILKLLFPVLFSLPIALFLWGVIKFIYAAGEGDDEKVKEGKRSIFWGLIALAIVLGLWGFLELIINVFGFNDFGSLPTTPPIPVLP